MSRFSQMIGSFERTGSYPMEANYIFPTFSDLKAFFDLPENLVTMHKGLLKIVENDGEGNQVLYWVTRKQTNNELEFTPLVTSGTGSSIEDLLEKLEKEIQDRKEAVEAIWGTNDPSMIPEDLDSILGIANEIVDLRDRLEAQEEFKHTWDDKLREIIGTDEEDYMAYLHTLSYDSITALSEALDKMIGDPPISEDFESLKNIESYIKALEQELRIRDKNLQKEINDTQTGVGLDGDGKYSPDQETNYLKDATSVMNALKILDALVNDGMGEYQWEYNEADGNATFIKNDEIIYTVNLKEIFREVYAPINNPILTGLPQVETSPDAGDISNRIPTTSWVNKEIVRLIWGNYG